MQVGRCRATRVARQGDHLPRQDQLSLVDQEPRGVTIHGLIPLRMSQEHVQTVIDIDPRGRHSAASGRPDGGPDRHRDVDPRVRFRGIPGAYLTSGHESLHVERPMAGR